MDPVPEYEVYHSPQEEESSWMELIPNHEMYRAPQWDDGDDESVEDVTPSCQGVVPK